jgi:hypothetical protein
MKRPRSPLFPILPSFVRNAGSSTYSYPSPILSDGSPIEINYAMSAATNNLLFSVDGYTFSAGPNPDLRITVWPQYPTGATFSDFFQVAQGVATPDAVFSTNYSGYALDSTSAQFFGDLNFLQSTALPSTFRAADVLPGDDGGYLTATTVVLQQGSNLYSVSGLIDTVQVTPEPASFLFRGMGLGTLAIARRRISTAAS